MHWNMELFLGLGLCLLPGVVALVIILRRISKTKQAARMPFDDLQRRPAGEALRLKIQDLDDKMLMRLLWLLLFPLAMAQAFYLQPNKNWISILMYGLFSIPIAIIAGISAHKILQQRIRYQLGYLGEIYVGEELTRLIALGFQIYHDVPFDEFNMDHIAVGPRGVFVVETKTRRKPHSKSRVDVTVQYDGNFLHWPRGSDRRGIDQAKNNAKTLAKWLSAATGQTIWVTPILTLPGWMVELKVPNEGLYVLNPKQIFPVCKSLPEKLNAQQIQQICYQLDQKCKISLAK